MYDGSRSAYVLGGMSAWSREGGLRGRLWFSGFRVRRVFAGRPCPFGSIGRRRDRRTRSLEPAAMSFDRLKRIHLWKRSPGYKLKPSRPLFKNSTTTHLNENRLLPWARCGKHKVRVALRGSAEQFLVERDLAVSAAGRRELLALLRAPPPGGRFPARPDRSDWRAPSPLGGGAGQAGHAVAVINPLMARPALPGQELAARE